MKYKNCEICNKKLYKSYTCSSKKWEITKFCSRRCFYEQHKPWLGKKRLDLSKKMKDQYKNGLRNPIKMFGENNSAWKGNKAGYSAFHHWLSNHLKRTYWCFLGDHKIIKKSEFANISGNHDHNIEYYIESCTKHHRLFDMNRESFFYG